MEYKVTVSAGRGGQPGIRERIGKRRTALSLMWGKTNGVLLKFQKIGESPPAKCIL